MDVSSLISQIPISSAKSAVNAAQGLAIEKGKQLVAGQEQLLLDEISALERKVNDITKEYAQKFDSLEKQVTNKEITREKYDELIVKEKEAFKNEQDTLTKSIKEKKDKIFNLVKSLPKKIKADLKAADDKVKAEILKTKTKLKGLKIKRPTKIFSKVKAMIKSNPAPLILATLTIAAQLVSVRNKRIELLVDDLNDFIDSIKTKEDVAKAKLLRDNALRIIQENERKILAMKSTIDRIGLIVSIVTIIAALGDVLLPIPVPSPAPDVVTPVKERFRKKYELALKILEALTAILPIVSSVLERIIDDLQEQKDRIQEINNILEDNINMDNQELNSLTNSINLSLSGSGFGKTNLEYKGFKFVLKEENDSKFVVAGNKRRYAVALNKDGSEVIQSQRSFTQDPDILIEELKLIIDQRNLKA
jgi:exonuclease VII large subunit